MPELIYSPNYLSDDPSVLVVFVVVGPPIWYESAYCVVFKVHAQRRIAAAVVALVGILHRSPVSEAAVFERRRGSSFFVGAKNQGRVENSQFNNAPSVISR